METLKFSVLELQEHLDTYNAKREAAELVSHDTLHSSVRSSAFFLTGSQFLSFFLRSNSLGASQNCYSGRFYGLGAQQEALATRLRSPCAMNGNRKAELTPQKTSHDPLALTLAVHGCI